MDSRKDLYVTIAGNIKKERKRLSISQVQLAEKADVSVDTIKSFDRKRTLCAHNHNKSYTRRKQ